MKARYAIVLSTLAGVTIGGIAVQTLHAQAKPPVYAIALNQLIDPEGYAKDYLPKARPAIQAHGGIYVAAGKGTVITGDVPHDRVVVLRFESLDALKNWFNSSDYQAANAIGQKYAHYNIVAVDGVKQ
jgi:putative cofactor-binding repeat protein